MTREFTFSVAMLDGSYNVSAKEETNIYSRKTLVDEIGQTAVTMLQELLGDVESNCGSITIIVED